MTEPGQMTPADADERPTTPEVPPAPGADVDPDELQHGSAGQTGAPPTSAPPAENAAGDAATPTTSPTLDHLAHTIKKAEQAASEALSPQQP